jgi:hypothetical protein
MQIGKRIIDFFFLFLGFLICTHANGMGEMPGEIEVQEIMGFRELEEQYNIKVAPISFPGTTAYDFVYVNSDTIIIVKPLQLVELNISTGEQKPIELPEGWNERVFLGFRELQYDRITNSIHMKFLERRIDGGTRYSYHILRLEDHTWESIDELGDDINFCWYDAENMLIYVSNFRVVTVFDLRKREILESIQLPQRENPGNTEIQLVGYIHCMYGNPLKILASPFGANNGPRYRYIIFDTATRTTTFFMESTMESTIDSKINLSGFNWYIPVDDNWCFLAVNARGGHESAIVKLDLQSNTMETVILDDFPYDIYNFKQIAAGRYGFMMGTRNSIGGHGQSYLCFLDYP